MPVHPFPIPNDGSNSLYPMSTANTEDGGAVKYWLRMDAVEFVRGRSGPSGESMTAQFLVKFDDCWKWVKKMRGYSSVPNPGDGGLKRSPPERIGWPIDPTTTPASSQLPLPLYCVECNFLRAYSNGLKSTDTGYLEAWKLSPQPIEAWNHWPRPLWAEYECTFSSLDYNVYTDTDSTWLGFNGNAKSEWNRYATLRERPMAESEKVPGGTAWYDLGAAAGVGLNRYKPLWEVTARRGCISRVELKLLNVPAVPESYLTTASGSVNSADLVVKLPNNRSRTFAAEKLIFDTWEYSQTAAPLGTWGFDLTYHFIARLDDRTWNQVWDPRGQAGATKYSLVRGTVTANAATVSPYFDSKDFKTTIFKFS